MTSDQEQTDRYENEQQQQEEDEEPVSDTSLWETILSFFDVSNLNSEQKIIRFFSIGSAVLFVLIVVVWLYRFGPAVSSGSNGGNGKVQSWETVKKEAQKRLNEGKSTFRDANEARDLSLYEETIDQYKQGLKKLRTYERRVRKNNPNFDVTKRSLWGKLQRRLRQARDRRDEIQKEKNKIKKLDDEVKKKYHAAVAKIETAEKKLEEMKHAKDPERRNELHNQAEKAVSEAKERLKKLQEEHGGNKMLSEKVADLQTNRLFQLDRKLRSKGRSVDTD